MHNTEKESEGEVLAFLSKACWLVLLVSESWRSKRNLAARNTTMFIKVFALVYITVMLQFGEASESDAMMLSSQEISVEQTLISANQIFELGFFSPGNSSRRYLGIWFKAVPDTIIWVANRQKPLSASDESARLVLNKDGNLRVLDCNNKTVWSTNISVQLKNPVAILRDTGDLSLKEDNTSGRVVWESFTHPCDVYLSTIQLEINTKISDQLSWSSWTSEIDPAVGNFSATLLPQYPVQIVELKGEAIYWRSGPWNGLRYIGIPDTGLDYSNNWSIRQNKEKGIIYVDFNQVAEDTTIFMKIFPDGSIKYMERVGNNLSVTWEAPKNPCDVYGMCGSFGLCNAQESPICGCLRGFIPKSVEEWSKGNWTGGCVRRTQLLCSKNMSTNLSLTKGNNDGFWKLSRMKVPDRYQYFSSPDAQRCKEGCLGNCSCTAYAYVDGIGCLLWTGDLLDVQEFPSSGEDLFIRLDRSELVKGKKVIIITSIVSALVFIILFLLIAFGVYNVRNKQRKRTKRISKQFLLGSSSDAQQLLHWKTILQDELMTFDFEDIVTATNGFSHSNRLGEGGFGAVFRGKLQDGQEIAVKRLSDNSGQGIDELLNEILLISRLQHRNLVKVLGCSIEGEEKLIACEYLPNRSLDAFLFDSSKKNKLDWATRFNIIQGIARGISYLHQDSRLKVIHRDLKASNVLLDNNMNPKISDFGLARAFQGTQESENTHRVVGTYGYMSPEYALRGIFSEKSDVYSFGVLLLEIISGKKIRSFESSDEALGLLGYAWKLWKEGRELELIDESLVDTHSDQVVRCIRVGLVCVQDRADDRPTMPTVILMLSSDMLIPQPKPPLFVPESPSPDGCHPLEHNKTWSANEVTESHVQAR